MKLPKLETIKTIFIGILTVALILFIILQQKSCSKVKEQTALLIAYQDTVHQTKNALGQQISSIAVLQTSVHDLLQLNAGKDSMLALLQQEVKANRKATAVIVAKIEALDKGSSSTTVTYNKEDTLKTDSGTYIYPTYSTQWDEKWSKGLITASRDSIYREITYNEEYSVLFKNKGNGLFKPKTYTVEWKNINPNANTTGLRSYSYTPKRKNFYLGVGLGYGLNVTPGKTVTVTHGVQVGLYVGYKILEF